MNYSLSALSGNLRKTFGSVAFVAAILVSSAVSAQSITALGNAPAITKSTEDFQAFIFPVGNSTNMKVNFLNPQGENIVLTVHDQEKNVVYRKVIIGEAAYRGTFDMSMLSDGKYEVKVKSKKQIFTRTISIQTQQERIASAN